MKTKNIKQSVTFKSTPHEVYEVLMDSKKHSIFIGDTAKINRETGGKISAYGTYITGVNLELSPDKKIVQSWRANDWPEGHFSKVTFNLKKIKTGTKLDFTQSGVPENFYNDISDGWREYYWTPMKTMLEK